MSQPKYLNSELNNVLNTSMSTKRRRTLSDYKFVQKQGEFEKTSSLGKGAYGEVKLVEDKQKKKLYAMKIVIK